MEVARLLSRGYCCGVPRVVPLLEKTIQNEIRLALGREPDLTLWRNNTGHANYATDAGDRTVRYGLARGSADLIGVLAPSGRFVALEVKRPGGKLTDEQSMFLALVRKRGGFACVVESVEAARAAIGRARLGEHD